MAMADAITLDDLQRKQQALTDLCLRLQKETSPDQIQDLATRLQEEALALLQLGLAFEQQMQSRKRDPPRGEVEVVLTPDQRRRIKAETGEDLPSVLIPDSTGVVNQAMPGTSRDWVLAIALDQARKRKETVAAEQMAREQVDQALAEIDAQGGLVKEKLDELRKDPSFLSGMLQKRK